MTGTITVVASTAYPAVVASARVRLVEMGEHMTAHGVELVYRPSMSDAEYRAATGAGTVGTQAAALLRGAAVAQRPQHHDRGAISLVHRLRSLLPIPRDLYRTVDAFDFDDAIYVSSLGAHRRPLSLLKLEAGRAVHQIRAARLVLAGNGYLADAAAGLRGGISGIEVLPSCVNPEAYPLRQHEEGEVLTLGWTGSPTTSAYLGAILGWLRPLGLKGRIRLLAMGANLPRAEGWIECLPWSLQGEAALLERIDVGLMPLLDDPWTRGKCGYKLLRYAAAGVPSVGSPVGVNAQMFESGCGIAARNQAEWHEALRTLSNPAVRREVGVAARAHVERAYSFCVWAPVAAQLLQRLS